MRYNRTLTNYYSKAIAKEEKREGLLKDALGLSTVEHRVISQFPVITTDSRIVSYNRIKRSRGAAWPAVGEDGAFMTKGESERAIRQLCHQWRTSYRYDDTPEGDLSFSHFSPGA